MNEQLQKNKLSQSVLCGSHIQVYSIGKEKLLLTDLHFTIFAGDFIVVLGNNGSGKSSLLKLCNGTLAKNEGELSFLGKKVQNFDLKKETDEIATITQDVGQSTFGSLTVWENLLLFAKSRQSFWSFSKKRLNLLELQASFLKKCPQLVTRLHTQVTHLSGGERQLLTLFLYLLYPPKLLLLDEHTSALDPRASEQVMAQTQQAIEQHQLTVVMTTHKIEHALLYGNRLWIIKEGKILYDLNQEQKQKLKTEQLLTMAYE